MTYYSFFAYPSALYVSHLINTPERQLKEASLDFSCPTTSTKSSSSTRPTACSHTPNKKTPQASTKNLRHFSGGKEGIMYYRCTLLLHFDASAKSRSK